jgi:hypothetical protein
VKSSIFILASATRDVAINLNMPTTRGRPLPRAFPGRRQMTQYSPPILALSRSSGVIRSGFY